MDLANGFIFCILARVFLAYLIYKSNFLKMAARMFVAVVAFVWILMSMDIIKRDTGPEAGGKIWWKHMRPFHALMYMISLYFVKSNDNEMAALTLLADVAVGTIVRYDYRSGK